jgi:hypothetical protein
VAALDVPPTPDPMTQPLPVAAPRTWKAREDRVRWCNENLTSGEIALLIRLRADARPTDGQIRRSDCDRVIADEKKTLPAS